MKYEAVAALTGIVVFVLIWGYCSVEYGFLGFALGWMPATILGIILGMLWPLILALIGLVILGLIFIALAK